MNYTYDKNRFYVTNDDGQEIGEVTWSPSDKLLIIDHTYVDEAYRGLGIAETLVSLVVQKAREEGYLIFPLCPFAKREFERRSEYHDVLNTR